MDNIYKEGSIVYAKEAPQLALVIRRYLSKIYYCRVKDDPDREELVYFERELRDSPEEPANNS